MEVFACVHAPHSGCPDLLDFSPAQQRIDSCTVLLDVRGLSRIWPTLHELGNALQDFVPHSSVAITRSAVTAYQVCLNYEGLTVAAPGEELRLLQNLPVEALPQSDAFKDTLYDWGLKTIGDLLRIPVEQLIERTGGEGLAARAWATGQATGLFQRDEEDRLYQVSMELEDPVANLQPLSFVIARLLFDLAKDLDRDSLATNELQLELKLVSGASDYRHYSLPAALVEHKALHKIVMLQLESRPPREPVHKVTIIAQPAARRALQKGFFVPTPPSPDDLELTMVRIGRLVGREQIGSPVIRDTHKPDSWETRHFALDLKAQPPVIPDRSESRGVLRYFRPALTARVRLQGQAPVWIDSMNARGPILRACGPWRLSGDWWRLDQAWRREEWDVEVNDGTIFRVYCDGCKNWFVDGYYD